MTCGKQLDNNRKSLRRIIFFPTSHAFSTSKDYMAHVILKQILSYGKKDRVVTCDLTLDYCSVVVKL